ncbi:OmpA/MotB domain-containing protein (plasmid) [Sulfuricella denitrificans skB26]|uniref:Peptidoglycan-associated lipoprotein n=1 Tax=Sulfuricella denitrificans (strain DSM 22764 / NBRC 105220 / skB26) TaxID=1163617 RepID=S6AKC9_SULDS|nr:peptidoglycan-associated lipoprotein Pal [Sulfuricella denitrificans]BAN36856.1 OmpA/MotB domain-containing protein [Sulfuricella denitrificans skB26]
MKKTLFSVLLVSLLAACAGQDVKDQPKTAAENSAAKQASINTQSAGQQSVTTNPLKDPNNILSKRSVYYDFDKSDVKDEYTPMIEAHSKYLTSNKNAKLTVQGNCDERGSREYNIALGNRRADSVKKIMNVFGASDSQIEVVSFGEEKPRTACHDESCWKENRRSDIVYQGE